MRMNLFSLIVTECSDGSVVFRFGDESEKAAVDEINNSRVDVHASPASAADTEGSAVVSLHSCYTFTDV